MQVAVRLALLSFLRRLPTGKDVAWLRDGHPQLGVVPAVIPQHAQRGLAPAELWAHIRVVDFSLLRRRWSLYNAQHNSDTEGRPRLQEQAVKALLYV